MTKTLRDISPSKEALAKARKMGEEAAKNDTWMEPLPEEHIQDDDPDDVGTMSEEHKDAWCGTEHFQHHYGRPLSDLTDEEEERITGEVGGLSHIDLGRYEGLYIPLRDAFFDAWEEGVKFYEKAQVAIAEHKKG
jgi:hypothetical protein